MAVNEKGMRPTMLTQQHNSHTHQVFMKKKNTQQHSRPKGERNAPKLPDCSNDILHHLLIPIQKFL